MYRFLGCVERLVSSLFGCFPSFLCGVPGGFGSFLRDLFARLSHFFGRFLGLLCGLFSCCGGFLGRYRGFLYSQFGGFLSFPRRLSGNFYGFLP